MRTTALSLSVFLSVFAMGPGAHAEVVRCTDANGAISYTDGACPASSRQSRQVPIMESPPPAPRAPSDEAHRSDPAPQQSPPRAAQPLAQTTPSGPSIIPRNPDARPAQEPAQDPGTVVILSPDPYYDGWRPARRPSPPRAQDPGPPPGQRPCNLAGIKRNNC